MTDRAAVGSRPAEGPRPGPLFVVGAARTGSTLLRHVLNRSPRICLASETHFLRWSARHRLAERLAAVRAADDRAAALRPIVDDFYAADAWIWIRRNVPPEELAARLAAGDLDERHAFATLLELYAERRCDLAPDGVRGEKTPAHLGGVPRLVSWFPDARVIHTFRDPRAIYASELRRVEEGRWGPKARLPWLPDRLVDPLLAPAQAARTAIAWRRAARLHARYATELGSRYRLLRFEDLVADPAGELRGVCDFLGVEFTDALLEGIDVVGSSFHAARHASTGIDPGAATRWRTDVSPAVRRWFALALGARMRAFGYDA